MAENPKPPRKLTMQFRPVNPSSRALGMDFHGHVAGASECGYQHYAGIVTLPDGNYVATFHAKLPDDWLVDAKLKRRRGRPKDEPAKVAIALHECLVHTIKEAYDKPVQKLRVEAARAMNWGGSDENAEREMRRESKHETARAALAGHRAVLTFAGTTQGDGRLVMAIHESASVTWKAGRLKVVGVVWICQWGQRRATYGKVDFEIPINDAPENPQKIIDYCMGVVDAEPEHSNSRP